jgi:hypothetical protein
VADVLVQRGSEDWCRLADRHIEKREGGKMMLLVLLAGLITEVQPEDRAQQAEFLRLSYKANTDAFLFGSFRFEFTRGSAASLADAEAGRMQKAAKADGFYVFDERNARYELEMDVATMASTMGKDKRGLSTWAPIFRMLTDRKVTLLDTVNLMDPSSNSFHHQAQIFPGIDIVAHQCDFPLNIGNLDWRTFDLYSDLTRIKDGAVTLDELDPHSSVGDNPVYKVVLAFKGGKRTYWIDVNRGSVPLRILDDYENSRDNAHVTLSDLVQLPNAGWLPRRRLSIYGDGRSVSQIIVTSADTVKKPATSLFQLEFPEPIGMIDKPRSRSYKPRKVWSLLNLPSASSPGARPIIIHSGPPPERAGETVPGYSWMTLVLLGVLLAAICLIAVLIIRFRSGHREV